MGAKAKSQLRDDIEPTDYIMQFLSFHVISKRTVWSHSDTPSDGPSVFTDGYKMEEVVGVGVYS